MKSLVLVLVFLAWFVTPAIADFDAGMAAYQRGDYVTAFREFKPLAEKGPNDRLAPIHNRMPVILAPKGYEQWLDPELQAADGVKPFLRPFRPT